MTEDELLGVVREVAVEVLAVDPDAVAPQARFRQDLDVDSLELIDFIGSLERRLRVRLTEEDFKDVETVGDALKVLVRTSESRT